MKRKSRTNNQNLMGTIKSLNMFGKQNQAEIWKDLSRRLSKSNKNRARVNLSKIQRFTRPNEVVAIPGKVLGSGSISHPVTVGAFSFSDNARKKITKAGGKCFSLGELSQKNPKGKGVKVMR
jgi:large subunit ribosomal protein L18e